MRNLSLAGGHIINLSGPSNVAAVSFDLDQGDLYVALERETQGGDADVQIRKFTRSEEVRGVSQGYQTDGQSIISTFITPAYSTSNPWSSSKKPSEVVLFHLLPDSRMLVLIMRGGEIATVSLDEEILAVEVVGSFESGILAASWSPDDSVLVLVTADSKLILMTSTFDVITETDVHSTEFGEDSPINVGWGSKQTQFHGSLGKAAAQAQRPSIVGSSPDDDGLPRISWRGDGSLFVVSALSPLPDDPEDALTAAQKRRRILRFYSHAGALQSTSEPTPGLEHALAWRPSGNWIVGTQRYGFPGGGDGRVGRHDLVMFERNGLRRGDFSLDSVLRSPNNSIEPAKWGYRVREVSWSSDSNVLSIWVEKDAGDTGETRFVRQNLPLKYEYLVQLWTTGNYHWYLKHEIVAPPKEDGTPGRFTSVTWHPENALTVILTTPTSIAERSYSWETLASTSTPPNDSGTVAVFDGASILLTPFRTQNVPPPMSSHQFALRQEQPSASRRPLIPVHAAFSPSSDILAILWETGHIELTDLQTRLGPGKGKVMDPTTLWVGTVDQEGVSSEGSCRQVQLLIGREPEEQKITRLVVLGSNTTDFVSVLSVENNIVVDRMKKTLPQRNGRLLTSNNKILWQAPDGEIFTVDDSIPPETPQAHFPEFCYQAERVSPAQWMLSSSGTTNSGDPPLSFYIGLSSSGKLHIANAEGNRILANNANSFVVSSGFLVFTTTAHVAHFAPLDQIPGILSQTGDSLPEWETRRVERGSRIVTAVPSTMSLVLQMPRGNLETVNPRPLVMKIVRQDIDSGNYSKAFSACRRHRIDLTVFIEHQKDVFLSKIGSFLDQVDDVDYINLFLTSIGQSNLPAEIVSQACDGIREELENRDLKKYVNSILTAHVVKRPPDHESGLSVLLRIRDTEPQLVEDAVKYIIFLVDADKLFDTALGMYDFSLVLMIAQHSQKDPREYLPFLRELRALEKFYQRFKIDDHLRRYETALKNLSLAGEDRFDEAMLYVEKHQLYDAALSIWKATDKYDVRAVLDVYGDWLFERREFKDAAFVFRQGHKLKKAMVAHERALDWQELFDLAVQEKTPEEELIERAHRVADDLTSKKRYQEAARVLLDYAKDLRAAVIALVQGNHFSEARRQITIQAQPGLLEEIVFPGALESRAQIAEEINEMREQLRKQLSRIRELRIKKVEEPDAFFGVEDTELHNVDVMTDISMAPTAFTRYTVAPSAVSKSSKRTSRSKRKMERKVGSGRKGTVDEEEYLLKSVTKLVTRFNTTQNDAIALLPHLFQFTDEHKGEGLSLQNDLIEFGAELQNSVVEIWRKQEPEGQNGSTDGWATRMLELEKRRQIDPLDKVVQPDISKREWDPKLSRVVS